MKSFEEIAIGKIYNFNKKRYCYYKPNNVYDPKNGKWLYAESLKNVCILDIKTCRTPLTPLKIGYVKHILANILLTNGEILWIAIGPNSYLYESIYEVR